MLQPSSPDNKRRFLHSARVCFVKRQILRKLPFGASSDAAEARQFDLILSPSLKTFRSSNLVRIWNWTECGYSKSFEPKLGPAVNQSLNQPVLPSKASDRTEDLAYLELRLKCQVERN